MEIIFFSLSALDASCHTPSANLVQHFALPNRSPAYLRLSLLTLARSRDRWRGCNVMKWQVSSCRAAGIHSYQPPRTASVANLSEFSKCSRLRLVGATIAESHLRVIAHVVSAGLRVARAITRNNFAALNGKKSCTMRDCVSEAVSARVRVYVETFIFIEKGKLSPRVSLYGVLLFDATHFSTTRELTVCERAHLSHAFAREMYSRDKKKPGVILTSLVSPSINRVATF